MVAGGIVGVTSADAAGQRQHARSRCPSRRDAGRRSTTRATRSRSSRAPSTTATDDVPLGARARATSARRSRQRSSTLRVRFSACGFGVATATGPADAQGLRRTTSTRSGKVARARSRLGCRQRHRAARSQDEAAQAVPVQPAARDVDAAVRHEPGVPPRHRRQPRSCSSRIDADRQAERAAGRRPRGRRARSQRRARRRRRRRATVSPSANSPSSIASASLSTSCFWITRFSGRAP